ncbi:MAG: AAA family ATPase, partial [Chloroflexota bacterium]
FLPLMFSLFLSYRIHIRREENNLNRSAHFRREDTSKQFELEYSQVGVEVSTSHQFNYKLASALTQRTYFFNAERLNISEYQIAANRELQPNAANLPQVLHYLSSSNIVRFNSFNRLVNRVFPHIKQIVAPPNNGPNARILVWNIDPKTEREDLALPLSECGTGIGQVLAMLYVVLTSDFPRPIIIDEPQSFLHPGAIRKLFEIFREYPQHQYIITTHSPTAVTAANPQSLFLVCKEETESHIEQINIHEAQSLRLFLAEVGARLSDVFGADNILWVEGATEEECFPLIISKIVQQPLYGTVILGLVNTGDFESKLADRVIEIYKRLSAGNGLLPPAIGFIFDRENRTEQNMSDLDKLSGETVHFLLRKMYENYLLNPSAIAELMTSIEGFRDTSVTAGEIEIWLEQNRWQQQYFHPKVAELDMSDETWLKLVDGAKLLKNIFNELSESRVEYDKVKYGLALTRWIVEKAPNDLSEISMLLQSVIQSEKTN